MTSCVRSLIVAALLASFQMAPAAYAKDKHPGRYFGHPAPHGRYYERDHRGGNAAAAAIIGGLIGLGVGAAITSGGYPPPPGYYGPPPAYYGPPGYYASPPPGIYYGY